MGHPSRKIPSKVQVVQYFDKDVKQKFNWYELFVLFLVTAHAKELYDWKD